MKSFIKKISNSDICIFLRNSINFRPVYLKYHQKNHPICVSDAFIWRTDNGYKTKFKYSDILNLFYKIKNSWVEFHFYSKNNELIKVKKIESLDLSNEFEINSEYLDNLEDYGVFYVYHFSNETDNLDNKDIISNRCYLGYSFNNNLYSFVHGNTLVKFTNIFSKNFFYSDLVKTSFFQNHTYTIQKYFDSFDKSELFFTNPTSKLIKLTIENKSYRLKSNCSLLVQTNTNLVSIKSNCLFLRPTIFSYKGEYLDVHHS